MGERAASQPISFSFLVSWLKYCPLSWLPLSVLLSLGDTTVSSLLVRWLVSPALEILAHVPSGV